MWGSVRLRYDDFSEIGSQTSPRIGLVNKINENHSLKFLYGEAFRAPSESELNLINNPVLLGNSNLKPESVQSLDLIWIGEWESSIISLGYFENRFTDAIVETLGNQGIPEYLNIDQGPSKGFELELKYQVNQNWLLRANFTDITEKPIDSYREADQLASFIANYLNDDWGINLIATWHNERELAALDNNGQRVTLNDNWLLNTKFHYNFNQHWRAFLQIKNLSDEEYFTPALGAQLTEGVANRGREYLLGVNWYF